MTQPVKEQPINGQSIDLTTTQRLKQVNDAGLPIIAARGPLLNHDTAYAVVNPLKNGGSEVVIPASQTPFGARFSVSASGEINRRFNRPGSVNVGPEYASALAEAATYKPVPAFFLMNPHTEKMGKYIHADTVEIRAIHDRTSGLVYCFPWKKGDGEQLDTNVSANVSYSGPQTIDTRLSQVQEFGLPITEESKEALPMGLELGWYVGGILSDGSPELIVPYDSSVNPFVDRRGEASRVFSQLNGDVAEGLSRAAEAMGAQVSAEDFRRRRSGALSPNVTDVAVVVHGIYDAANDRIACFPLPSERMVKKTA